MAAIPAVAALLIFAAVVVAVIVLVLLPPIYITIWRTHRFHASYCYISVIGVVLMLICQSVSFQNVGQGMKGDEHIQPYGILIIFMAL